MLLLASILCSAAPVRAGTGDLALPGKGGFLGELASGFDDLIVTRGTYVTDDYLDLNAFLAAGRQCSRFEVRSASGEALDGSIVHAPSDAVLAIEAGPALAPADPCGGLEHYQLIVSTDAATPLMFVPRDVGVVTLTFDADEEYLFVPLSAERSARLNTWMDSFTDPDTRDAAAIHAILVNHLEGIAIGDLGESSRAQGAATLWVRQRSDPAPPSTTALIQGALSEDEALLVLSEADGRIASHLVGRDFVTGTRGTVDRDELLAIRDRMHGILGIDALVAQRGVARLRDAADPTELRTRGPLPEAPWTRLGAAVIDDTFAPHLDRIRRLWIVAPGELATLPYAAIVNPLTGHALIEDFTLAILPDLVSLTARPEPPLAHAPGSALVLGDPTTPTGDVDFVFPPLPGARREARTVAGLWETQALIGADATPGAVRARMPEAKVVHVAAHGVSDSRSPLRGSFLALGGDAPGSGRLTGMDILNSPLRDTRLAVMSACQTGLGHAHDQGVIGLARAFYVAGVPQVVMSLWNVDDEATTVLMTHFHEGLRTLPPAEALRAAILETRRVHPEISRWASFMMLGFG